MAYRARIGGAVQEDERSGGGVLNYTYPDRERRIFSRVNDTPIGNRGNQDGRNTTIGRGRGDE